VEQLDGIASALDRTFCHLHKGFSVFNLFYLTSHEKTLFRKGGDES
jgi:hypothetical protein